MRRRLLQATLLAVAVTALVLGIPLAVSALKLVEDLTRGDLSGRAQQIATRLDEQVAAGEPIELANVRLVIPHEARLTVRVRDQRYSYGDDPGEDPIVETVSMVGGGTVKLAVPSGPVRTKQLQVAGGVLLLAAFSATAGGFVAILTARRLAEPLRHVAGRASRLGAGDFRPDPRRHGLPELDRVADALDASGAALSQLMQRERELVGDVSHQLRSRLTALQLRLEALSETDDPETAEEAGAALEQAERLSGVLDDLLAAATAARARDAEPLDVSAELSTVAEEWRDHFRSEGRTLRPRIEEGLLARATPARLREAIGVLLDNALRHGEGTVSLSGRYASGTVLVQVADSGPGVPDELVPHVFTRGFSGGGSTGVGLALARALVEADGGRLELSSARPATFEIYLPVARADDVLGVPWRTDSTPR
ncbi:ATP-binding protein [Actinopolyspora mortivallis]|uniref:Signal transduction histidine-protein kinase/phosphatase MprB n=1 Tax=Actinopolyspora mortivallis TaxID=33906 RepID=A0A2T0GRP8_ACTMO|nr:ATP-binding protein [Actinopolyspora mortivallis]PRW61723.1 histidine kinase [Actinopolyspora mortivallis]